MLGKYVHGEIKVVNFKAKIGALNLWQGVVKVLEVLSKNIIVGVGHFILA